MKKINCILFSLGCFLCILLMQCAPVDQTQQPGVQAQPDPPPPPPPPKPQWYWVGSSDQHATDYKWRLQYYANNHMDSTTKHIVSDLNDMRIGVSTYGDYGGHIADATAPLDFVNGEVTRMKVDTLLTLMKQITQIDSAGVFKAYFNDHNDELMGKQKKGK